MQQHHKASMLVELSLLQAHKKNYKVHSEKQIARLMSSLERFGQVRSIVIQEREDGSCLLVAGHGVVEAARRLGWGVLRADVLPYFWKEEEVEGYLLADNRLHDEQSVDEEMLMALVEQQSNHGYDLDSLGFSEKEVNELFAQLEEHVRQVVESPTEHAFPPLFPEGAAPSLPLPIMASTTEPEERERTPLLVTELTTESRAVTPSEKAESYFHGTIRQIVLLFTPLEFVWMVERCKQIQAHHPEITNNTKAVVAAIREYTKDYPATIVDDPFEERVG